MTPPIIPEGPKWSVPNKEVRGFTWRQLIWVIGSLAIVEFTLLGVYYSINTRIDVATSINAAQAEDIHNSKAEIEGIKIHLERVDTRVDNMEREVYMKGDRGLQTNNNRPSRVHTY